MKKLLIIKALMLLLITAAIMLSFTQCRKSLENVTPAGGEKVCITLNVSNGSRHDVNPENGLVTYTEGDVIYVGNEGKYIGTLTCHEADDHYVFVGDITNPQTTDYLHFYFIGGLNVDLSSLTVGETTSFDVDISNQATTLPVLSYVHTAEHYYGETAYRCMLENKCGLVKFTLANGNSEAVKITGMKTGATINFADPGNPIVANGTRDAITMKSENETEKLAIILPQDAVTDGLVLIDGVAYSYDMAAVTDNDYLTINIDNTTPSTDKVFTVSKNGNVVRFSLGNLQYDKRTSKYSFMEHQYDVVETEYQNVGENYSRQDIVGLFGWGTGDNPTMTSEDTLDYEVFKDWGDYCGDPTGNSYHWYTLSEDEWAWLIGIRSQADPGVNCREGNRFLNAIITVDKNTYYGLIIFPDGYDGSIGSYTYNNYDGRTNVSDDDWSAMETVGAVFLPAAGERGGPDVLDNYDKIGNYWSSTIEPDYPYHVLSDNIAYQLLISDGFYGTAVGPNSLDRCFYGHSVRLVR